MAAFGINRRAVQGKGDVLFDDDDVFAVLDCLKVLRGLRRRSRQGVDGDPDGRDQGDRRNCQSNTKQQLLITLRGR